MIPVAGRRRGQATNVAPAVAAENVSLQRGAEPDWLFDNDDDNNNNNRRQIIPSASTSATTRVPPTVPSAQDALSFLDFDDEPMVISTTMPPAAPAAPSSSAVPSTSTFLSPRSVPLAGTLGVRERETGTVPPPPFLVPDTPVSDVIPSSSSHPTSLSSSLKIRCEELQRESQIIEAELQEREKCIKLLESNEDELCKEVKALEEEVRVKKEKEEEGEVLLKLTKEVLEEKRQKLFEERDAFQRDEFDKELNILKTQYESEIRRIETSVNEQEALLLDLGEKHAAMSKTISMTDYFENALQKIEEKLGKGIHSMGTSMCIRVKPILIDNIRDTVADARQQRLDIISNDRQKRREELDSFHEIIKKNMSEFRQERREKHKIRLDSIFGHSISQSRSALETRLSTSRQQFLEQQKVATSESQRYIQHAIDEIVKRSGEDLKNLEKKFHEELKRTESQNTAELEHHARLYTAEREAGIRSQRRAEDENNMKSLTPSVYKSAEKSINLLRERVEQLKHSVIFDIQELSSSLPKYGNSNNNNNNNTRGIREKEVMLEEYMRRTSQLSQQLQIKWEQFRSAISPLEQCVNLLSESLQEGRVKNASMLQSIECIYRAWNQDVRRELSHCFTSNAASSDSVELESTTACMTHVLDDILTHLQGLMITHTNVYAERKIFGSDIIQQVSELSTQRQNSEILLQSVLETCNNLARLTAEVETKQTTLSMEEEEYKVAKQQLEKEKAEFNERLKSVQNLSAKLRRETSQLETKVIPRGYTEENTRVLCDMTSESIHSENTNFKIRRKGTYQKQELRKPIMGETTIPYIGASTVENDTGGSSRNESSTGFVSLLTVEDTSPIQMVTEEADEAEERRQSCASSYALSSYRMCAGGESRSLTTPSTSNS
ncbi:uncharacterized protein TM35_000342230 [Trypanosoma theileri]|uniref:Uncharacterized protein n=1 Tax=Trypanosoma theileri TaxID=67003 RepID=A0A1X0NM30_9TRYP|nr:uncharacterized protein TM35_000342230 [Trypanosoma theileri]ORC85611.1 hypothetical protein TM35_000342230 [Trypanosoma theileri]